MLAASDPLPGSVTATAVSGGVGVPSGLRNRSCCSVVPRCSIGALKKPLDVIRLPMPMSPWHSSCWISTWVSRSVTPPPPNFSLIMNDVSPRSDAFSHTSSGDSVSASSTARARGRMWSAANFLASSTNCSCSAVSRRPSRTVRPISHP
nr:hypothetical protein [Lentzea kentuckyensis]